jgi:hypothetical protein
MIVLGLGQINHIHQKEGKYSLKEINIFFKIIYYTSILNKFLILNNFLDWEIEYKKERYNTRHKDTRKRDTIQDIKIQEREIQYKT